MFTKNHLIITGNITKQAETVTAGKTTVTRARLINNQKIHRAEGEPIERVTPIDIEVWGARGEAFAAHVTSKVPVYVEGTLEQSTWEKDGQNHSQVFVRVADWQFLSTGGVTSTAEASPEKKPTNKKKAA